MSGVLHKSAAASEIPNETPSNNGSSSRVVGQQLEASNNIITAEVVDNNQLDIYREDNKDRQFVLKVLTKLLRYLDPRKSCDNGQRIINVHCISKVIKWVCKYFVNAWNLEELVGVSFDSQSTLVSSNKEHLDRLKKTLGDFKLIDHQHRRPTSLLVDLMRDIVSQLVRLHESGITHGDLKPQNIVIVQGIRRLLCAKLSDISQQLPDLNRSASLGHHSNGFGMEDMHSLGYVLLFCTTGNKHQFGDDYSTSMESLKKDLPEAHDLISLLLSLTPEERPNGIEVLNHLLLWDLEKRFSFIYDINELRNKYPKLMEELNKVTLRDLGVYKKGDQLTTWDQHIPEDLLKHMLKYSQYDYRSFTDLLRFIRNLWTHYKQVPRNIKVSIRIKHRKDLDGFIRSRFPYLLMKIYEVVRTYYKEEEDVEEEDFEEYFKGASV